MTYHRQNSDEMHRRGSSTPVASHNWPKTFIVPQYAAALSITTAVLLVLAVHVTVTAGSAPPTSLGGTPAEASRRGGTALGAASVVSTTSPSSQEQPRARGTSPSSQEQPRGVGGTGTEEHGGENRMRITIHFQDRGTSGPETAMPIAVVQRFRDLVALAGVRLMRKEEVEEEETGGRVPSAQEMIVSDAQQQHQGNKHNLSGIGSTSFPSPQGVPEVLGPPPEKKMGSATEVDLPRRTTSNVDASSSTRPSPVEEPGSWGEGLFEELAKSPPTVLEQFAVSPTPTPSTVLEQLAAEGAPRRRLADANDTGGLADASATLLASVERTLDEHVLLAHSTAQVEWPVLFSRFGGWPRVGHLKAAVLGQARQDIARVLWGLGAAEKDRGSSSANIGPNNDSLLGPISEADRHLLRCFEEDLMALSWKEQEEEHGGAEEVDRGPGARTRSGQVLSGASEGTSPTAREGGRHGRGPGKEIGVRPQRGMRGKQPDRLVGRGTTPRGGLEFLSTWCENQDLRGTQMMRLFAMKLDATIQQLAARGFELLSPELEYKSRFVESLDNADFLVDEQGNLVKPLKFLLLEGGRSLEKDEMKLNLGDLLPHQKNNGGAHKDLHLLFQFAPGLPGDLDLDTQLKTILQGLPKKRVVGNNAELVAAPAFAEDRDRRIVASPRLTFFPCSCYTTARLLRSHVFSSKQLRRTRFLGRRLEVWRKSSKNPCKKMIEDHRAVRSAVRTTTQGIGVPIVSCKPREVVSYDLQIQSYHS